MCMPFTGIYEVCRFPTSRSILNSQYTVSGGASVLWLLLTIRVLDHAVIILEEEERSR